LMGIGAIEKKEFEKIFKELWRHCKFQLTLTCE
jgi:hypothetical protein